MGWRRALALAALAGGADGMRDASASEAVGLAEALALQVPDLPWSGDPWPLTDIATALSGLCPFIAAYHGDAARRLADAAAALVVAAAQGQSQGNGSRAFGLDVEDALYRAFEDAMAALVALNRALDRWQGPRVDEALQPEAWQMFDTMLSRARAVMEESGAGEERTNSQVVASVLWIMARSI